LVICVSVAFVTRRQKIMNVTFSGRCVVIPSYGHADFS